MSVHQYKSADLNTASPLTIEVTAFRRVTAALEGCARETTDDGRDPTARIQRRIRLSNAIYDNSRLWIALLDDLANPANRLSAELKANLASLAATSVRHGGKILSGQGNLSLLIEINRAVMNGLQQARFNAMRAVTANQESQYASCQA